LNGITSLPNIMKIYKAVQKLLVGDTQTDRQSDRQTGDLISLLSFLESRLKIMSMCINLKHYRLGILNIPKTIAKCRRYNLHFKHFFVVHAILIVTCKSIATIKHRILCC